MYVAGLFDCVVFALQLLGNVIKLNDGETVKFCVYVCMCLCVCVCVPFPFTTHTTHTHIHSRTCKHMHL